MSSHNDKALECQRYDSRATSQLSEDKGEGFSSSRNELSLALQTPYLFYEDQIKINVHNKKNKILEIGSGTGAFTEILLKTGAEVYVTDISENSLRVILNKAKKFTNLHVKVADMEILPFKNDYFDVVTCAGSLSYGDNEVVLSEIYRILKKGGVFICVDSLNHNPIYRINRWIHFIRGNRTMSTLKRMPTVNLIEQYDKIFGSSNVYYFGMISWFAPVLRIFISESKISSISNFFDRFFKVKKSAFKFVMVIKKV